MRRLEIILTIGDISIRGGAERVVVNLAEALCEVGHKVEILSFYRSNESLPYAINPQIKITFLHQHSQDSMRKRLFYKLYYKVYESYIVNKMYPNADVMIFNNSPHFPFFKNPKTRYIKFVHTSFKRFLRRLNFFDALVVLSNKEIETWRKYHKNVVVIPNFVKVFSNEVSSLDQKRVLCVGRITPNDEKGFFRLVDIWEEVCKDPKNKVWELCLIAGVESAKEEPFKEKLEQKIKQKNLQDSVILKPFSKEIEKEYLRASIYAMSSYAEGLPMVLVEVASFGIPSVAFDINTGPSDIIENGVSGFLVTDGDLGEYARALEKLMGNEELRREMGAKAKMIVEDKFSKDKVMVQWEELFRELLLR